jgi:hypothetical protein
VMPPAIPNHRPLGPGACLGMETHFFGSKMVKTG